jgi:hypothetical protein
MPSLYLLDTNAYCLFFQHPKHACYERFTQRLSAGKTISFYMSEITSMEVHSVLGKWRRGRSVQKQSCLRHISLQGGMEKCSNMWTSIEIKRMRPMVYHDLLKLLADIQNQRGDIQATILKVSETSTTIAQELLIRNADRFAFGSHDALIAATLISARKNGLDLTLVTSDKGLKAVLRRESLPFYDPLNDL